jgi:hypothetical protein
MCRRRFRRGQLASLRQHQGDAQSKNGQTQKISDNAIHQTCRDSNNKPQVNRIVTREKTSPEWKWQLFSISGRDASQASGERLKYCLGRLGEASLPK